MASSRFAYSLQPLLASLAARESAARLRHVQAVAVLEGRVRDLVSLERSAGRLAEALAVAAPAWRLGEVDRCLARLEAARLVRLGEIAAARARIEETRTALEVIVRRRQALERHRARCLERFRRALEAAEEAELEEAEMLRRGSALAGCELVSA